MRARLLLAMGGILFATACVDRDTATDAAFRQSGRTIAMSGGAGGAKNACFLCHGLQGQGDGDTAPRLAGLDAGYLQKQLGDYASRSRPDDVMTPIARRLRDQDMRLVSAHYASLSAPSSPAGTPPPPAFTRGGARSCAACHGAAGEGLGPANPAIAGQPAAYTTEQLNRWRRAERRNDPQSVMSRAVAGLSQAEVRRIAVWLAGAPTSRPPASAAASGSGGE